MALNTHDQNVFHARWTEDRTTPQGLQHHLAGVAQRARSHAERMKCKDLSFASAAFLAGLLHDLGKYCVESQNYLNSGDRGRRSNDTAHAIYAAAAGESIWDSLAVSFAIADDHAGLHDPDKLILQISSEQFNAVNRFSDLLNRADAREELAGIFQNLKPRELDASDSLARLKFDKNAPADVRRFEVFVRVLFSILVDADRLDSEKFEEEHRRQRSWERPIRSLDASALLNRLNDARGARASQKRNSGSGLNELRDSVFNACRDRARSCPQGFFSLTVPTGGGKSYSSSPMSQLRYSWNDSGT